jgi:ferrous iron transport protein A
MNSSLQSLDQLQRGQHGHIGALVSNASFGPLDRLVTLRLQELGFLPGAKLEVIGHGFLSRDPVAVRLGSTKFALRLAEARKVMVQVTTLP